MKIRKIIAFLLVTTILLATNLVGCSKASTKEILDDKSPTDTLTKDTSDGNVELTFWTLGGRQEAADEIIKSFMDENPNIKITASYYDTDGIKDALKVAASSDTLPNMWFNWGGSLGGFYAENGLTYDLTDYAKTHDWDNIFLPGALNLCYLEDQLAGYPTAYNVLGVYYRKDIFEEYGLKVPQTFEDFENICAILKENGITPISTAGLNGWHVMRVVELLFEHYAGPEMHDKLSAFEESWDNPKVVQALSKYKEFCEKGYFPDGFITADPDDTKLEFFSGQAAMDIEGQWYDGVIIQDEQDISNYGVFTFPSGGTNRMSAFVDMMQFSAKNTDAELEASMKFTDYYYNEENPVKYAEFYSLPIPKIGAPMPAGQPNVEAMMDMSSETGTFTITDQAFPPEIARGLFDVQDAIALGTMTPEEGAKAIQTAVENYQNQ